MTYEEFQRRFIARMVEKAGQAVDDDDAHGGKSYAKQAAESYWEENAADDRDNPEDAADTDMSYWESA